MYEHLSIRRDGVIARVVLERPEVKNAVNAELIAELTTAFNALRNESVLRAVVLEGKGTHFSAGGDIKWMRASIDLSEEANRHDTVKLAVLLRTIDTMPQAVIGKVHGGALGLGMGLVAVCDVAVAADDTVFAFPETKLGITPAVISPFVLAKIGYSHARALFVTGERFGAERAKAIGLVHDVAPLADLEARVASVLRNVLTGGPSAIGWAKELLLSIRDAAYDESQTITAGLLAKQRVTAEAQEGLRAFLERRKPAWSAGSS
jgi:methylglutaconyl-CoA hydratase